MATFTKQKLSEDLSGIGFALVDGTPLIVHTTPISSTIFDEVWLYVANRSFTNPGIIQLNMTTDENFISTSVQVPVLSGMFLLIPGLVLTGSGTESSTVAVTDMTGLFEDALSVYGYVNRITP
jgi:hypothetical protein